MGLFTIRRRIVVRGGRRTSCARGLRNLKTLADTPILLEVGDYDAPRVASLGTFAASIGNQATVLALTEEGLFGNCHVVTIEKNNLQVADLLIERLESIVPGLGANEGGANGRAPVGCRRLLSPDSAMHVELESLET